MSYYVVKFLYLLLSRLTKLRMNTDDITHVKHYLLNLQNHICSALEAEEPEARFVEDVWERAEGGGGKSRILENGTVFEQAGVNFSHVLANSDNL